jgi:hypothetical protein
MRSALLILVLSCVASSAVAEEWSAYENARFGYVVDIPPGYLGKGESDNGDGQIFKSADGTQTLRVHGGHAPDGFEATVATAMDSAREAGWRLSYERVTPSWASFSGARSGIVSYARAIALCGGSGFASFESHYPERDLDAMQAVVERLVSSLKPTGKGVGC